MKMPKRLGLAGLLLTMALVLASCAGAGGSGSGQQEEESQGGEMSGMDMGESTSTGGMQDMGSGDMAPRELIVDGEYSDERFIDMLAGHHQMAIEMAQVEQENGEIPELRQIADNIVSSQQSELEELSSLKQSRFGSSELPSMMNMEDQAMYAMTMPDELAQEGSVDQNFIDSMLPHHSGAIELASIARLRSDDPEIQRIARNVIDEQSREIGEQIQIRQQYYPEAA